MKLSLLAICVGLGLVAHTQTFQWDNEQPVQQARSIELQNNETGLALVYPDYYEGNPTALGENYRQNLLTGAHQKLPLGTMVKVTRLDNGMSTTVRINDRGAYCDGCVIDLSTAAAQQISLATAGRTKVMLSVISTEEPKALAITKAETSQPEPQLTVKGGATPIVPHEYNDINPSTVTSNHTAEPRFTRKGVDTQAYEQTTPSRSNTVEDEVDIVSAQAMAPPNYIAVPGAVNVIAQPVSMYSVQLGSYSKLTNAERHVHRLNEAGFNNIFLLREKRTDGSILNRVIIAPFETLDEALDYQDDLSTYQDMKSLILKARG